MSLQAADAAEAAASTAAAASCKHRQRLTEAERLQADIARMPIEPHGSSTAKAAAAQHAEIKRWMEGVAFEQLWVGKVRQDDPACDSRGEGKEGKGREGKGAAADLRLAACLFCQHVVDVFPLAPVDSRHYLSSLQGPLFKLLRSTIPQPPNDPLEDSNLDGLGFGITVRRVRSKKPEGASAEQTAELTAAHRGVMVAGCVVQPLYSVELRDKITRLATRQHAFLLHYAATKEGEQRKGFMRFLLDGQLRLMAGERSSEDMWWQRGGSASCSSSTTEMSELSCNNLHDCCWFSVQPRCPTRTPVATSSSSTRLAMAIGKIQLSPDSESNRLTELPAHTSPPSRLLACDPFAIVFQLHLPQSF